MLKSTNEKFLTNVFPCFPMERLISPYHKRVQGRVAGVVTTPLGQTILPKMSFVARFKAAPLLDRLVNKSSHDRLHLSFEKGSGRVEWLSSWLAEQEVRG